MRVNFRRPQEAGLGSSVRLTGARPAVLVRELLKVAQPAESLERGSCRCARRRDGAPLDRSWLSGPNVPAPDRNSVVVRLVHDVPADLARSRRSSAPRGSCRRRQRTGVFDRRLARRFTWHDRPPRCRRSIRSAVSARRTFVSVRAGSSQWAERAREAVTSRVRPELDGPVETGRFARGDGTLFFTLSDTSSSGGAGDGAPGVVEEAEERCLPGSRTRRPHHPALLPASCR